MKKFICLSFNVVLMIIVLTSCDSFRDTENDISLTFDKNTENDISLIVDTNAENDIEIMEKNNISPTDSVDAITIIKSVNHPTYLGNIDTAYVFQKQFGPDVIAIDNIEIIPKSPHPFVEINTHIRNKDIIWEIMLITHTELNEKEACELAIDYLPPDFEKNFCFSGSYKYIPEGVGRTYYIIEYDNIISYEDSENQDVYLSTARIQMNGNNGLISEVYFGLEFPNYLFQPDRNGLSKEAWFEWIEYANISLEKLPNEMKRK